MTEVCSPERKKQIRSEALLYGAVLACFAVVLTVTFYYSGSWTRLPVPFLMIVIVAVIGAMLGGFLSWSSIAGRVERLVVRCVLISSAATLSCLIIAALALGILGAPFLVMLESSTPAGIGNWSRIPLILASSVIIVFTHGLPFAMKAFAIPLLFCAFAWTLVFDIVRRGAR